MTSKKPQKSKSSKSKLLIVLLTLLPLYVTACATAGSEPKPLASRTIPPWPKAGPAVAAELDRVCPIEKKPDGTEVSSCPAIDEWMGRLDKHRQQLEVAR